MCDDGDDYGEPHPDCPHHPTPPEPADPCACCRKCGATVPCPESARGDACEGCCYCGVQESESEDTEAAAVPNIEGARRTYEDTIAAAKWSRLSELERVIMTRGEEPDGTSWLKPTDEDGGAEIRAAVHLRRSGLIDTCVHAYWRTRDGRRVAEHGRKAGGR